MTLLPPPDAAGMENYTYNSLILQIEGFRITTTSKYPVFILLLVSYIFIMVANGCMVALIWMQRSLHQPMYLLFCNLSINDIVGNSLLIPQALSNVLLPPRERLIHYYACAIQAYTAHIFGTNAHGVLMVMAYDRYVAICNPLRYSAIMSNRMVLRLTATTWGTAVVFVSVLLGLTLRLDRCRTLIRNMYCDNPSLFKLSCESVYANNVFGLFYTVILFTASIGSVLLTYSKILSVCLSSNCKSLNSKALKTCSTHLSLYLIMLVSGLIPIVFHRLPHYDDYRKISVLLFVVIPGSLNPLIYGLQSQEIHKCLSNFFCARKG